MFVFAGRVPDPMTYDGMVPVTPPESMIEGTGMGVPPSIFTYRVVIGDPTTSTLGAGSGLGPNTSYLRVRR